MINYWLEKDKAEQAKAVHSFTITAGANHHCGCGTVTYACGMGTYHCGNIIMNVLPSCVPCGSGSVYCGNVPVDGNCSFTYSENVFTC